MINADEVKKFIEEMNGIKLSEWQKSCIDSFVNKNCVFVPARCSGKQFILDAYLNCIKKLEEMGK